MATEPLVAILGSGEKGVRGLIEILPNTRPEEVVTSDQNFLCVDSQKFGIENAIRWVKEFNQCKPFTNSHLPSVFVVIYASDIRNSSTLIDELPQLAYPFYIPDCSNFEEIFYKLTHGLVEQVVRDNDDWKTKQGGKASC